MTQKQENERLARVEEKTDNIEKKVDELDVKFDRFIEAADKKFAPAWVGKAMTWFIMLVMGAVITALLATVIIKDSQVPQTKTEVKVSS